MQLENQSQVLISTLGRSKVTGVPARALVGQRVSEEERGVNRLGELAGTDPRIEAHAPFRSRLGSALKIIALAAALNAWAAASR
jgi:hypothetical protein